jgi:hypothetical protein
MTEQKITYGVKADKSISQCRAKDKSKCPYHTEHKEYTKDQAQAYMEAYNELYAVKLGVMRKGAKQRREDAEAERWRAVVDAEITEADAAISDLRDLVKSGDYDNESLYAAFNAVSITSTEKEYRKDELASRHDEALEILADGIDIDGPSGDEDAMDMVRGQHGRRWLGYKFAARLAERHDITPELANDLIDYDADKPVNSVERAHVRSAGYDDGDHGSSIALSQRIIDRTGKDNQHRLSLSRIAGYTPAYGGTKNPKREAITRYALRKVHWTVRDMTNAYGSGVWFANDRLHLYARSAAARERPEGVKAKDYVDMIDRSVKLTDEQKHALAGKLTSHGDNVAYIRKLNYDTDANLVLAWARAHRDKASWAAFTDDVAERCANGQLVSPSVVKAAGYESYDAAAADYGDMEY